MYLRPFMHLIGVMTGSARLLKKIGNLLLKKFNYPRSFSPTHSEWVTNRHFSLKFRIWKQTVTFETWGPSDIWCQGSFALLQYYLDMPMSTQYLDRSRGRLLFLWRWLFSWWAQDVQIIVTGPPTGRRSVAQGPSTEEQLYTLNAQVMNLLFNSRTSQSIWAQV